MTSTNLGWLMMTDLLHTLIIMQSYISPDKRYYYFFDYGHQLFIAAFQSHGSFQVLVPVVHHKL